MTAVSSKYRVKIHPDILDLRGINVLAVDFKKYKNTQEHEERFGRDAPFVKDADLKFYDVAKVHLIPLGKWNPSKSQFGNTTDAKHLVYCTHPTIPELLCVLDLLGPNAHDEIKKPSVRTAILRRAEGFGMYREQQAS